jgi:hypothetical protein
MNAHQERVLQSFRRVQGWYAANPQYVAAESPTRITALATQLEALSGIVRRATEHVAEQDTQLAQSLLISKDEREMRRELLTHHMASIAKVARALRGTVPGIGVLTMPKGNIQSAALITAAGVMARKSEVYSTVLAENGLPTDFATQLEQAAAGLKRSLDARGLARSARTAASRGIEAELGLGRRVVDIMDVTLTRVLRSQPSKLAEWKHLKRVTVRGARPQGGAMSVEGTPTRVEGSPTRLEGLPALRNGSPTLPDRSPTEVVGSPTEQDRAA